MTREVCVDTGLPASPSCPEVRTELFLAGHVPPETCYLHRGLGDLPLRGTGTAGYDSIPP